MDQGKACNGGIKEPTDEKRSPKATMFDNPRRMTQNNTTLH